MSVRVSQRATHTSRRTIRALIRNARILGFDTNALIYLLEQVPPYHQWLHGVFESIQAGDRTAVVSVMCEAEMRVQPLRMGNRGMSGKQELTLAHPSVLVVPVDRDIARKGAEIRAELDLKLPDALIVATAVIHNCDALIGNDKACAQRVTEIPYIYLDEAVKA